MASSCRIAFSENPVAVSPANRKPDGCAGIQPRNKKLSDPPRRRSQLPKIFSRPRTNKVGHLGTFAPWGGALTLEWGRSCDRRNRPGRSPLHQKNGLPQIGAANPVAGEPRSQDKMVIAE
jgi:hypothetical protein